MSESSSEREYNYQQLRIPKYLRKALKKYRDSHEDTNTLSDAIIAVLPEDVGLNKVEIEEDEFVLISVNEEAHGRVHGLAGENITSYTVIERFFRDKAEEEGRADLVDVLNKQSEDEEE